jgi:hypothetical protein
MCIYFLKKEFIQYIRNNNMVYFDFLIPGIIILIILIITYYFGKYNQQINHINGFYETDNEFNKEAGLSVFSFYIGDLTKCCYTQNKLSYNGYLLMVSNNNVIINERVEFCLYSNIQYNINDLITHNRNLKFTIVFNNLETNLLPKIMNVDFYQLTNKIVFYKDDKIYGVFFKNPVLSELEQISKEKTILINSDKDINKIDITDENCESI